MSSERTSRPVRDYGLARSGSPVYAATIGTEDVAVMGEARHPVGRIALIQFQVSGRRRVRNVDGQCVYGFTNVNFYAEDIFRQTKRLESFGCEAWTEPLVHDMGEMGQPIEVMLEGPDGVIINLIQLAGDKPEARVLRTRAWIEDHGGWNRCGGTPVVTTAHHLRSYARGMAFYTQVLGMSVRNDTVLGGENMEKFTRFPQGARARDTYVRGALQELIQKA